VSTQHEVMWLSQRLLGRAPRNAPNRADVSGGGGPGMQSQHHLMQPQYRGYLCPFHVPHLWPLRVWRMPSWLHTFLPGRSATGSVVLQLLRQLLAHRNLPTRWRASFQW